MSTILHIRPTKVKIFIPQSQQLQLFALHLEIFCKTREETKHRIKCEIPFKNKDILGTRT